MILRSVSLLFFFALTSNQELVSKADVCFFRCIAQCIAFVSKEQNTNTTGSFNSCQPQCQKLKNDAACSDQSCWSTCNGRLESEKTLPAPMNVTVTGVRSIAWNHVPGAVLYYVRFKIHNKKQYADKDFLISAENEVDLSTIKKVNPCAELDVMVAAFSEDGIGNESVEVKVPHPSPTADPKLELIGMQYFNTSLISDFYQANATVFVEFRYFTNNWFLGQDDLDVQPLFHLISCVDPDLSQGIPVPDFYVHQKNSTISTSIGSDMMDRKCRYVYYLQSVSSKTCGTITEMPSPPSEALQTVLVECDIVKNAPCFKVPVYPHPQCGQVEDVKVSVMPQDRDYLHDPSAKLAVNVTFIPSSWGDDIPTVYYVGIYGEAVEYRTKEEEAFLGVNITKVLGQETSCQVFENSSGNCMRENTNRSIIISGLASGSLYGLTICGVKDVRNVSLPDLSSTSKSSRPKAVKILLLQHRSSNPTGWIIGVVVGVSVALLAILVLCRCYYRRDRKEKIKKYKLEIQMSKESRNRYTDFPVSARNDIWEIERRNLIIYNENKLGAGAFGAVYLGKLIGKSLAHQDANSPLGINLMRAENCEVAVKMLPEYADEMCKHEFLREIALMKTLGYHERLVNMLACITDSEPLCLIVEFCDDGDLLHYLRERCKYMMKLDDLSISYHDPPINENYDPAMIISLKQLLQFAVQISFGLEFLSQKGFIHRDVAARNILVHGGTSCKIGDFGLCRYIYAEQSQYKSKGGRLPLKWMSPEAIRHYEFSVKSDVWSFGVLLFEIITLGGSPYPGMPPEDVLPFLESGGKIEKPDNCPDHFYDVMEKCWSLVPDARIEFSDVRMRLASQLEDITEDYSYLKLDAAKDYYNVHYADENKEDKLAVNENTKKDISGNL